MNLFFLLLIGTVFAAPTTQPTLNPVQVRQPGEDCNSEFPCNTDVGYCRAPFRRTVGGVFGTCCDRRVGDGCALCRRNSIGPMRFFNGSCERCQNSQFKLQYGRCSYKPI
jgi:hypothetical protein